MVIDYMTMESLQYKDFGDDYSKKDPFKKYAMQVASRTAENLKDLGFPEVSASRGESAHVIDLGPFYLAGVIEGLGTKNCIADAMYKLDSSRSYYDAVAIDTVASIVNDLITVCARPLSVFPHWSIGNNDWLQDEIRSHDLINGWAAACDDSMAIYAGGETPTNRGILYPEAAELSGSAFGIIQPKERLTLGEKLEAGDHIVLIESSGIHANGVSLARGIIEKLPETYLTKLPSGKSIGEALLARSHIYARLQETLFQRNADIHYRVNMTGHGWSKLMRANKDFTYNMKVIPPPPEEFLYLQQAGPISDYRAYEAFNMGAGFAFFVPKKEVEKVQVTAEEMGFQSWDAGIVEIVEDGSKQVFIEPLNLHYGREMLDLR